MVEFIKSIIGSSGLIGSYFWYRYAFWNQDLFTYFFSGGNVFAGGTGFPIVCGIISLFIFIAGIFGD